MESSHERGTDVGTVDDLHASATKACGLDDFGSDDDNYREALGVLLESYRREADFTELGSKMSRFFLRNALVARLLSEAAWKQHPQHADVKIERPIFVTGLPRTGTTALHRLLSADPRHQGLELWLAEFPQPRPPRETWSDNPVFQQLDAQFTKAHNENPDYTGLHYMTADEVEECWQLLRQSLHSVSYETLAHVPTYARWLAEQDWTKPYQRHRRNLQLIGLNDAEKRWVLKNPSHLFALDALFATYPDALVIQCHRPAETIMASMCSLAQHTTAGWSNTFVGETIGKDSLETWSRGLELFNAERAKHDPAQFYDMDYFDFIADPVRETEAIYRHFGIDLTDAARQAMERYARRKQERPAGAEAHLLAGRLRVNRRSGQGAIQRAVTSIDEQPGAVGHFVCKEAAVLIIDLNSDDIRAESLPRTIVIGAGPVGLAVATGLRRRGVDVLVLESGSDNASSGSDFNDGDVLGLQFTGLEKRGRGLGGGTSEWAGQCLRFHAADFCAREWISGSGWPLGYDDLLPFYSEAEQFFGGFLRPLLCQGVARLRAGAGRPGGSRRTCSF